MARLEVALRSPIAFGPPRHAGFAPALHELRVSPEPASIRFKGRDFVWHPPLAREFEETGLERFGPMVSVVIAGDAERQSVAASLQRFLSAVAFAYDRSVEDTRGSGYGGSGEVDALNPSGPRLPRAFSWIEKLDPPAEISVVADPTLEVALAYYREGLNAGSPFYSFLAFWNVLCAVCAVFDVEQETARVGGRRLPSPDALSRDVFIRQEAPRQSWRDLGEPVVDDVATYFRDDARNAIAHVVRRRGRAVNPDDPVERIRISNDASRIHPIARAAITHRWPNTVLLVAAERE